MQILRENPGKICRGWVRDFENELAGAGENAKSGRIWSCDPSRTLLSHDPITSGILTISRRQMVGTRQSGSPAVHPGHAHKRI
jgi:hypothetical protein